MLKYSLAEWALDIQPRLREAGCVPLNQLPGYRDSGLVKGTGFRPWGFYIDFVNVEHETMFIMRFTK